jgi:translocation and assembly module TamB
MADTPRDQAPPDAAPPRAPDDRAAAASQHKEYEHTGRLLLWSLITPLLLLLALVTGVLVWAASDGSLASALRMAEARLPPLHASDVSGAILGGGRIGRLTWEQDGLVVQVDDLTLKWAPRALLRRTLAIRELAARRITVRDQRPANPSPSSGLPRLPPLPLALRVDALQMGQVQWVGPPALALEHVAARLATHGARYQLDLERVDVAQGRYQGRAVLVAGRTMTLDVALSGALATPAVDGLAPQHVTLRATLQGPISDMSAQADLRVATGNDTETLPVPPPVPTADGHTGGTTGAATAGAPERGDAPALQVAARITPWETFSLAEAHATLHAIDAAALFKDAPRTLLDGELNLTPGSDATREAWDLTARLTNRAAGPWDRHQVPIDGLDAHATWSASTGALLDALTLKLAGGTLDATGRFGPLPSRATTDDPAPDADAHAHAGVPWHIEARMADIQPERLLSTLAGAPIGGSAKAEGRSAAPIRFDVALQAAHAPARAQAESPPPALDLRALRLRHLDAQGEWADGGLTLEHVRVQADDAELAGRARMRPAGKDALAGSADLRFTAPGAHATVRGELQPTQGAGNIELAVSDAARWLAWARTLPGAARALEGMEARGTLALTGQWRGGWRDPTLQAHLATPRLSFLRASAGPDAAPLELRDMDLTLNGRLAQAQLRTRGSLQQGKRQIQWTLAADGGRAARGASLARSDWRLNLTELQLRASDPALGSGTWQAATTGAVPITWAKNALGVAPGELRVTAPASSAQATVAWKNSRWQKGALQTSGHVTGVPLQWIDLLNSAQDKKRTHVAGNLMFNGDWDIQVGRSLQAQIDVARAGGDLTLMATDPETDVQARISAGLREARAQLNVSGGNATVNVLWDSERAGRVEATLQTPLAANPDKSAAFPWSWSNNAPVQGRIQARLPTISTWSILAPPGWRLRGALTADVRIAGSAADPQLSGTLAADQLALRSVVDGVQLQGGTLRAHLEGPRLVLDEFALHGPGADGGTLRASGEAGWIAGQFQARLATTISQLRASVRSDRRVTVSGTLQTALQDGLVSADGNVHVDRALIVLPNSSRPTLGSDVVVHGAGTPGRAAPTAADAGNAPPGKLRAKVDVQINLGDDFQLRGMGIDTRLAGTLALTSDGPLAQMPTLKGRVQTEGGRFQAYGQRLTIARGRIFFSGDVTNPGLDILALRPNYASDQKVGVEVQGTALLPQVHLYSDPALPDSQTLAWLMLGHAAPENGGEAALMQSAALAFLGGRESAGLASTFGLDELSFAQNTGTGQTGSNLTLGKRISNRLYAAYEQGLGGATSVLMIFYELSKRWVIRGQAGVSSAVDLIFKLNYGGP